MTKVLLTFCNWQVDIAAFKCSIFRNSCAVILSSQVGIAVHYQVLIGGGGREGSVSWDGGWVFQVKHGTNTPEDVFTHTTLTPEGDVASSTHIWGSWVGLSEGNCSCERIKELKLKAQNSSQHKFLLFNACTYICWSMYHYVCAMCKKKKLNCALYTVQVEKY